MSDDTTTNLISAVAASAIGGGAIGGLLENIRGVWRDKRKADAEERQSSASQDMQELKLVIEGQGQRINTLEMARDECMKAHAADQREIGRLQTKVEMLEKTINGSNVAGGK